MTRSLISYTGPSTFIFRMVLRGPLKRSLFKYPIKEEQWQLNCYTSYLFAEKKKSSKNNLLGNMLLEELIQIEAPRHKLLSDIKDSQVTPSFKSTAHIIVVI